MKTLFKNKITLSAFCIALTLCAGIYSCKKDASTSGNTNGTVTEADAVELTTDAVVPSYGGLVIQIGNSITIYKTVTLTCGEQKDTSINKSYNGSSLNYDYALSWNYLVDCSGGTPSQLTFNYNGNSSYNGPLMTSSDTTNGGFVFANVQDASNTYTLNTNYVRNGHQTSKIGRNYSFSSNLSIKSTNITIDKTTDQILSGTATIAITGSSSSGNSFSFSGILTFLGGDKATLVMNSGTSYTIKW